MSGARATGERKLQVNLTPAILSTAYFNKFRLTSLIMSFQNMWMHVSPNCVFWKCTIIFCSTSDATVDGQLIGKKNVTLDGQGEGRCFTGSDCNSTQVSGF